MKFISGLFACAVLSCLSLTALAQSPTLSLAGTWRFQLDRQDRGAQEQWFSRDLTDGIKLPGILQAQGYGDAISVDTPWVAALPRDMRWYLLPQYKPYTQAGHVQMPYLSQPPMHYLGVAWYQRDIDVPADWQNRPVSLLLERTRYESQVWIDDQAKGTYRSFVAPHEFDLGQLTPGRHRLTIRIDNDTRKIKPPYRPDGHSVSDSEGATWNGIVGRIELHVASPVYIDDAQVFPNLDKKLLHVKVLLANTTHNPGSGALTAGSTITPANWTATGGSAEFDLPIPSDAQPWSEFTPALQHLTIHLSGPDADNTRDLTYGLREIRRDGARMLLNGTPLEIRATHDGGGFPLTGYPAMDVASWKQIFSTCKSYGLNAMRFHSWCPPDAAFTAADELGFYIQPECGMWNSFDTGHQMLGVLNDETARMLKAYGNHPSFLLLSPTNEPAGHYQEQLPLWVNQWRTADPRRLYTTGTGRPSIPPGGADKGNDFLITGARGPRGWFGNDFQSSPFIGNLPVPALAHELGQWCAYPDYDVMAKFTGYLQPSNYQIARDSAAAHGLLENNKAIAHASGRFQVACYKEELEANQRTKGYSGFELLDLHDYLGQGTALIGVLDAFWESKGYVTPEEFRHFCNTTVLLARLKSRVFTTDQTLTCPVEICHYGPAPLTAAASSWRVTDSAGKTVASGAWPATDIPIGRGLVLGQVSVDLSKLPAPAQYKLTAALDGADFQNDWNFWLYPLPAQDQIFPGNTTVTRSWPRAESILAAGGKVLFIPAASDLDEANPRLTMTPIFWNRLMNPNGTSFLGLWCDSAHPALAEFPTEANCDWQWTDLFAGAHAINLDKLPPAVHPIVESIDDWTRNFKLGVIYECKVGPGKLLVCGLDLSTQRPGAAALKRSLLDYMASEKFTPTIEVPLQDIRNQWLSTRQPGYATEATQARPAQQQSPDVQAPQPAGPTTRP